MIDSAPELPGDGRDASAVPSRESSQGTDPHGGSALH